ncbi:MAG TPA: hypothetical protein VF109_01180, partial [Mycobacteriales bacterium]
MSTQGAHSGFGPNEWLVEEMYERYLDDPGSVDAAWHDFFADYAPDTGGNGRTGGAAATRVVVRPLDGQGEPTVLDRHPSAPATPTDAGASPPAAAPAPAPVPAGDAPAAPAAPSAPGAP